MVKCLLCGLEKKFSIVEHLRHVHKLSTKEYRSRFENAEVKSNELKELVSANNKQMWSDPEYHKKMCESRQTTHTTDEFRKKQSEIISSVYAGGFKNWNNGLTKDTDERVRLTGQKNAKNLAGRTKETHPYLKLHSDFMKENVSDEFKFRSSWTDNRREEWRQKISKSVCEAVLDGRCSSSNKFKRGWFTTKTGTQEFYDSSWEEEIMQFLETTQLIWTKTHGYKVSYVTANESIRRYIPDFFITDNTKKCILEIKGFNLDEDETTRKCLAAKAFAQNLGADYQVCFSVDEAKKYVTNFFEGK
jgi:hypothetical protein